MAQHLGEFLNGLLGFGGVERRQGIDVVERVEQEVRINLVAQVAQLGHRPGRFCILASLVGPHPLLGELDAGGRRGEDDEVDGVADDEQERVEGVRLARGAEHVVGEIHPVMLEDD